MNPHMYAVTGRPRCPSDQGSVESMNKLVKIILGTLLNERRLADDNPNWTEVLGMVAATINFLSMVVEKMTYHPLRPFMGKY